MGVRDGQDASPPSNEKKAGIFHWAAKPGGDHHDVSQGGYISYHDIDNHEISIDAYGGMLRYNYIFLHTIFSTLIVQSNENNHIYSHQSHISI